MGLDKADEMFEKLGYHKFDMFSNYINYMKMDNGRITDERILFWNNLKTFEKKDNSTDESLDINMAEFKAINEKLKILEWI